MRSFFGATILLLSSIWAVHAQSLNCDMAFTKVEMAICNSPSLLNQYSQLNHLTDRAIQDDVLSQEAADEFKNRLARSCRSSEELEFCLSGEIADAISSLSGSTDSTSPADSTAVYETSANKLLARLALADKRLRNTGDYESVVSALLALVQHYQSAPQTTAALDETDALIERLFEGCRDLTLRRQWNRVLRTYGWGCPLNFASSDF